MERQNSQAVKIHKQRVAAAAAGRLPTKRIRFADLASEYISLQGAKMSVNGRTRAIEIIRLHLSPRFGSRYADSMRPIDIERYRQERLSAGAKAATVNREWAVCKAILNKGESWGLLDRNPIRRGSVPMLPVDNSKLVFFEYSEWTSFSTAFDSDERWRRHIARSRRLGPVKDARGNRTARRFGGGRRPDSKATASYLQRLRECVPALKALLFTGSRLGEVLNIRWEDVDQKREVILIRQQKTRKPKTIPISSGLREALGAVPQGVGSGFVFCRASGEPLGHREVQRAFEVAKRVSGIRSELTPHTLRHTFASWLAINGTPLHTIQELLGHGDLRMTLRYAHLSPAHLREAVEVIVAATRQTGTVATSVAT
jgi:integrase